MSEGDEEVLNCAREFAYEEGLSIEVVDVSTSRGRVKARMRGVKVTPTIIIGKHKIEGRTSPEQLRNKLKNAYAFGSKNK
jgi:protein-disulfide isomerase